MIGWARGIVLEISSMRSWGMKTHVMYVETKSNGLTWFSED